MFNFRQWLANWIWPNNKETKQVAEKKSTLEAINRVLQLAREQKEVKPYTFDVCPPKLYRGVVPKGVKAAVAMDSAYAYANTAFAGQGFPGYPYLAALAVRPEYRSFAEALSTEHTREWIEFNSNSEDDAAKEAVQQKITEIENEFKRLGVRSAVQKAIEHDTFFGRGQLFIDLGVDEADRDIPLIVHKKTVKQGSLVGLS